MIPLEELWSIVLRLLAATVCGAAVGWNREREDKPAGLRTHMLVSLGAAAFTVLMVDLMKRYPEGKADATRIIQGIATGIGFLGAGSIMQSGRHISGITTAAGIWVVGAIGVACGAGAYVIAAVTVVFTLIVLGLVVKLEHHVPPGKPPQHKP